MFIKLNREMFIKFESNRREGKKGVISGVAEGGRGKIHTRMSELRKMWKKQSVKGK